MNYPSILLKNGIISARVFVPHHEKGFYRATRFDWAGIIKSLEFKGHNYFGPWYEQHDPFIHDSITGPVEEFSPVGYSGGIPGKSFLKPGVGELKNDSEDSFNKFKTYSISDYGLRDLDASDNEITFSHYITSGNYAYDYRKKLSLMPGEPVMEISHALVNTGDSILTTTVSNHNFFVIDGHETGPSFRLILPYPLKFADSSRTGDIPVIKNNILEFRRELRKDETLSPGFIEVPVTVTGFDVRIENINSGAGVDIKGDARLSGLYLWAACRTICPEPYIHINIPPGSTFNWYFRYKFYEL